MTLLLAFLSYFVKFVVFLCIAAGGFILGKKLRDKKNSKPARVSEK